MRTTLLALGLLLAADAWGANAWTKLEANTAGDWGNNLVYCPTRRRVLHYTGRTVLAFDAAKREWRPEYEWPGEKKPGRLSRHHSVATGGRGSMLANGMPPPAMTVNGLCWDSKRKQMVMTMAGLTCAYDPETRKWTDLGAKTVFSGRTSAGGPPVYGLSTCYDPVNDEILLFSHWSGTGNPDRLGIDDRTSGHLGTWRFRYADKTWRRVGDTFGSEELRAKREAVCEELRTLSRQLDAAYARRARLRTQPEQGGGDRRAKLDALNKRIREGRAELWRLDAQLRTDFRVEPPPRTGAPMVYVPKHKVIVLFGGYTGWYRTDLDDRRTWDDWRARNDTWVYDCATRQWRELPCKLRPPRAVAPVIAYDPKSGHVVLVTFGRNRDKTATVTLWSLDVAKEEWRRRGSAEWPGGVLSYGRGRGSEGPKPYIPLQIGTLDPEAGTFVVVQPDDFYKKQPSSTYLFELDLAKAPSEPALGWTPEPPHAPQALPPDDPTVMARLKALPANTWVDAKPKSRSASRRDWGNAAVDPVHGHVYYFGGGHSTYQIRDVAVYAPGANRWVHAPGDHNDFIPWAGWGGMGIGYHGAPPASHQRNAYVALDRRMYKSVGGWHKLNRGDTIPRGRKPGPRYPHFYDVDRGGVWRRIEMPEALIHREKDVDGVWSAVHVADPAGRIVGFIGDRTQYYGSTYPNVYVSIYDIYKNTLEIRNTGRPHPERVGESRPFCYLTGKNRLFFYEFSQDRKTKKVRREFTWVYDVATNKWIDLAPKRQPGVKPDTVLYVPGQDCVLLLRATRKKKAVQWVYSFKKNTWALLPFQGVPMYVGSPYGQVVYSPPYGVLVGVAGKTTLMRPDVTAVEWGE
jgi:hypothetical protein